MTAASPDRIDRASRFIEAGPEAVYEAFIDPAALAEWLPPKGARGIIDEFDPRPGGRFRMTLLFELSGGGKSGDDKDIVDGRFVELAPAERIVQSFSFVSSDPEFAGEMRMTWTLAPEPGGTLVSIAAEDVPPGIKPEDHAAGMDSSLANLAAWVEDREE